MKVKIKMNNKAVRQLSKAQIQAGGMTVEAVKTNVIAMNVMPFDSGSMQNEQTTIDTSKESKGYWSISVNAPQARLLYFHPEFHFQKINNPNAQGRWFDPWIDGDYKKYAPNAYKKFYRQLTQGVVH